MLRNRIFAMLIGTAALLSMWGTLAAPLFTAFSEEIVISSDTQELAVDLTGDGVTNIVDIIVMQKFMLGRLKLPERLLVPMDINGDGAVNAFDLVVFKRRLHHS